jgi:hypothetical protein
MRNLFLHSAAALLGVVALSALQELKVERTENLRVTALRFRRRL